ncbi:hypothetical protein P0136_06195 [Lentisphaerota bacterium ZTH]|nr:hypothetical protein JYG24_02695 [Lentisphaerota bacterium]WET07580.1 hypothetical protein P0136_06195 [Lentisphaerota bacterium ZTH]
MTPFLAIVSLFIMFSFCGCTSYDYIGEATRDREFQHIPGERFVLTHDCVLVADHEKKYIIPASPVRGTISFFNPRQPYPKSFYPGEKYLTSRVVGIIPAGTVLIVDRLELASSRGSGYKVNVLITYVDLPRFPFKNVDAYFLQDRSYPQSLNPGIALPDTRWFRCLFGFQGKVRAGFIQAVDYQGKLITSQMIKR